MAIPKAYQTGASQPLANDSLEDEKGFFYSIYNNLKYYFVFISISGAFILCLGKVFQRIETAYQSPTPSSSPTLSSSDLFRGSKSHIDSRNKSENDTIEKSKETSFLESISKFFPFKIGKDARAAPAAPNTTPSTTPGAAPQQADKTKQGADQPATPEFDPLSSSSEEEVKILQTLAHRRIELDKREETIVKKELVLVTAQNQVRDQMASLQKLKADIEETLKVADKAEKDKITGLVKIYESMKPKDAARIFNQMESRLLTDVVKMMSQKKISLILANMNVGKAKEITALIINLKSPYSVLDTRKNG